MLKLVGSHNGSAAVLKTAGRKPVGVRVPHPPQEVEQKWLVHN